MRQKAKGLKESAEATVRDIRRQMRKQYAAEEKIRIVVVGAVNRFSELRETSGHAAS